VYNEPRTLGSAAQRWYGDPVARPYAFSATGAGGPLKIVWAIRRSRLAETSRMPDRQSRTPCSGLGICT